MHPHVAALLTLHGVPFGPIPTIESMNADTN
jgi:hypothetical protein